jgi:hypothetical protein
MRQQVYVQTAATGLLGGCLPHMKEWQQQFSFSFKYYLFYSLVLRGNSTAQNSASLHQIMGD